MAKQNISPNLMLLIVLRSSLSLTLCWLQRGSRKSHTLFSSGAEF